MSDAISAAYREQELADRREQMLKYTDKLKEVRDKIEKLRKEETELLAKIDAFIK